MMPWRHVLLAIAFTILVGLGFPAVKLGMSEAPPLFLTAMRFTFSAFPAVFFIRKPNVTWGILLLYGLFIGVLQFGLLNSAIYLGFPSGLSSLVMQCQVFFTILLAFFVLHERPTNWQIAGALVAFSGVAVIGAGRMQALEQGAGQGALVGFAMLLAAALAWAGGNLVVKFVKGVNMLAFTVWTGLISPIPLLILSYFIEGPSAWSALSRLNFNFVAPVLYMAFGATLTGFGIWNWLLARHSAAQVTPFALLIPVVGFASGIFFFGETLHSAEVFGAGLIFAGLCLNVFGKRVWNSLSPERG